MRLSKQLNKKELVSYIEVCTKIWGCVPVDIDWARGTKLYQEYAKHSHQ